MLKITGVLDRLEHANTRAEALSSKNLGAEPAHAPHPSGEERVRTPKAEPRPFELRRCLTRPFELWLAEGREKVGGGTP